MKFYISSFFYKLLYLFFIIFKIYLNSINLFCNKIKFFSTKNKTYHQTTIKIPHTLQPTKLVKKKKRKKRIVHTWKCTFTTKYFYSSTILVARYSSVCSISNSRGAIRRFEIASVDPCEISGHEIAGHESILLECKAPFSLK